MVKLDFSTKIIILRKQSARNCLTFLKQNVPTCQVLPHLLLTGLALLDHLLLVVITWEVTSSLASSSNAEELCDEET